MVAMTHNRRGWIFACARLVAGSVLASLGLRVLKATAADDEGFVSLFNGKNLEGWEGDLKLWKVEDGMIVGDSPGIKQNEFLATHKKYSDFELRLEFRLQQGKGNSGVQFRSQRDPANSEVAGYQADLGENYWGCLYDEHRRNRILVQAPPELAKHLVKDAWNSYTIRAAGKQITLSINGFTTVDYTETDEKIAANGIIALQVHAGPPLRVEFRNVRLKELPRPENSGNSAKSSTSSQ